METFLFATSSIIVILVCAVFLFLITRAYWPEIKEIVYAQWLNFLSRFRREQLVNGDIIVLEGLIERPISEQNFNAIKVMAHEIFREGFDGELDIIRYYNALDTLYEKYGNESYYYNSDTYPR
jgi:hypothetical protein